MCNLLLFLGRYLSKAVLDHPGLELAFVWNRSKEAFEEEAGGEKVEKFVLEDLDRCAESKPDLIVEVAHPSIVQKVRICTIVKSWHFQYDNDNMRTFSLLRSTARRSFPCATSWSVLPLPWPPRPPRPG